jgi:hypothetical protein
VRWSRLPGAERDARRVAMIDRSRTAVGDHTCRRRCRTSVHDDQQGCHRAAIESLITPPGMTGPGRIPTSGTPTRTEVEPQREPIDPQVRSLEA